MPSYSVEIKVWNDDSSKTYGWKDFPDWFEENINLGGYKFRMKVDNTVPIILNNMALAVPKCEYAAIARLNLVDET